MGEACGLHQIGHADAIEPMLAKEAEGCFDDALAIMCGLLFGQLHCCSSRKTKRLLDIIMILVIVVLMMSLVINRVYCPGRPPSSDAGARCKDNSQHTPNLN